MHKIKVFWLVVKVIWFSLIFLVMFFSTAMSVIEKDYARATFSVILSLFNGLGAAFNIVKLKIITED